MSSTGNRASLFIISNRVYAKIDDAFYAGLIKRKLADNSYMVELANDKLERVREEDLIWLSFYGLPSSCWPETPVLQPTFSTEEIFEGKIKLVGPKAKYPASFTLRKSSETDKKGSLIGNGFSLPGTAELVKDKEEKPTKSRVFAGFSQEQGFEQPRSSVLRLNKDLLHKEKSPVDHRLPQSMISLNETTNLIPGYTRVNNPELQKKYNAKIFPLNHGESFRSVKEANKTGEAPGHETTTDAIRNWGKSIPLDQSNLTPPIIPCNSADFTSRERNGFEAIHERVPRGECSVLMRQNTKLLKKLAKKRRRRDMKKCRKVYGIDDREAWCMQCKWKKACTRYKECEEESPTGL